MATTLHIVESEPATRPEVLTPPPPSLSDERKLFYVAWQRVEAYTAYRWGERTAVFTVEGPGEWVPPLQPVSIDTVEIWIDDAWATVTPRPTALGGILLEQVAHYRIESTVGETADPPRAVKEAVFRLVEYFKGVDAVPSAERTATSLRTRRVNTGSIGQKVGAPYEEQVERQAGWVAKAMQASGAADLLRPWRNLGAI